MGDSYYPFFPGDYLKDTAQLTILEHGVYNLMMHNNYAAGELPSDRARLYLVVRANTEEEKKAVEFVASKFYKKVGDRLVNKRTEEELKRREEFLASQTAKGKKGAAARWGKEEERMAAAKAEAMPEAMPGLMPGLMPGHRPDDSPPSPSPSLSLELSPEQEVKGKGTRREKNPRVFVLPPDFDPEVWKAFEEHRRKKRASMTNHARCLIAGRLREFKEKFGDDPNAVMNQSIERGWQGVFELKDRKVPVVGTAAAPVEKSSALCVKPGCDRIGIVGRGKRMWCREHNPEA